MSELKPCPFCGGAPKIYGDTGYAYCPNDDCMVADVYWEEAILPVKKWNSRPIEDALNARIAELESKRRWRVVADGELPEDGEDVWVWDGKYLSMGYYLAFSGNFMDRYTPLREIRVTHWMPLPEQPKEASDDLT